MYSQQLDPEKYGNAGSIDEWSSLIQENQNDMSQITDAASQLTDEEWDNLEKEYSSESNSNENQDIAYAQKGAKLKQLKAASKGIAFEKGTTKSYARTEVMKKGGKKKKCECGCAVVTKKAKGGQLVDSCNCCGKVHDTQSFEQGGYIQRFKEPAGKINVKPNTQKPEDWKNWLGAGIAATTQMNKYVPLAQKALQVGNVAKNALGVGQLALGAGESMLPAIVGETGLATVGAGAGATAGGIGLGSLLLPATLTAGGLYLARPRPVGVEGKGNIWNPKTGAWEQGTRDANYDNRAATYESQPYSTKMNQTKSGHNVSGKWDETYKGEHKKWNEETQATSNYQKYLNTKGPGYNLEVNNKWDEATRQADKNYQTEMLKTPIIQDPDNTRVASKQQIKPQNADNSGAKNWLTKNQLAGRMMEGFGTTGHTQSTQSTQSTKSTSVNKKAQTAPINTKVQEWQKKLVSEGFLKNDKNALDGKWGKNTEAAYQKYMQNRDVINARGSVDDHVPFVEARQGFKKGGLISKKQAGGDSTSASSQVGVAKCGGKVKDRIKKAQDGGKTKNVLPVTNHVIKPLVSLKKAKGGDYLK